MLIFNGYLKGTNKTIESSNMTTIGSLLLGILNFRIMLLYNTLDRNVELYISPCLTHYIRVVSKHVHLAYLI